MEVSERLVLLFGELLDAHDDTVRLSERPASDWRWEAHLFYLRDLQRLGREALAAAATDAMSERAPSGRTRPLCGRSCQAGARRFRSSFLRRGNRRCARNGHGEGPA
jgi:hypothetical protein